MDLANLNITMLENGNITVESSFADSQYFQLLFNYLSTLQLSKTIVESYFIEAKKQNIDEKVIEQKLNEFEATIIALEKIYKNGLSKPPSSTKSNSNDSPYIDPESCFNKSISNHDDSEVDNFQQIPNGLIDWEDNNFIFDIIKNKFDIKNNKNETDENVINDENEEINTYLENENISLKYPHQQHLLTMTPMGIFNIDDNLHPYKHFQFSMGNTNFDITKNVKNIIKRVPGVESLSIFSRYKFLIGIGRVFDVETVRRNIEIALLGEDNVIKLEDEKLFSDIVKRLSKYKFWAIYVFPNGKYDYIYSNKETNKKFITKLKLMEHSVKLSSGYLLKSKNV